MNLPLPPGSTPIEPSDVGMGTFGIIFLIVVGLGALWRMRQWSFWHWFQMLVVVAVISFFIKVSQDTGEDFNRYIVAVTVGFAAYGATVGLNWLLTRLRQGRLPDE